MKKILKKLSLFIMALSLIAGPGTTDVFAASQGIYTATCKPHYRHPQTGVIEDAGGEGSAELGQSMTEGATHSQALVEVDEYGNTFVTVRLKLMDNISDVSFLIDGGQASPTLIKEDTANHTADYRMLVFSENSVITTSLYVAPMGRYVTYYITVSNLQPGSADFSPQISVEEPVTEEVVEEEPVTEELVEEPVEEIEVKNEGQNEVEDKGGLQEFDADGNKVEDKKTEEEKSNSGMIAGIIIVVAIAGAGAAYFISKKKK